MAEKGAHNTCKVNACAKVNGQLEKASPPGHRSDCVGFVGGNLMYLETDCATIDGESLCWNSTYDRNDELQASSPCPTTPAAANIDRAEVVGLKECASCDGPPRRNRVKTPGSGQIDRHCDSSTSAFPVGILLVVAGAGVALALLGFLGKSRQ